MTNNSPQQAVFLWAVPRSVSTAFERTLIQSGQFDVLHEPFTDCYYFGEDRRSDRYGDASDRKDSSGASVCRHILEYTGKRRFVKDLCFQAEPYVTDDFLAQVKSTFIVRAPDAVLASLINLKPDFTPHEFGFTALERIWRRVCALQNSPPLVLDGDHFRAYPERVLKEFCDVVGISYDDKMLRWEDGRIRGWEPYEAESQAKWHRTLERSNGIIPPAPRDNAGVANLRREVLTDAWRIYREVTSASLAPP